MILLFNKYNFRKSKLGNSMGYFLNITVLILLIGQFFINSVHAESSIVIDTTDIAGVSILDDSEGYAKILDKVDSTAAENGPNIANAFALANILGYPVGKAYLGSLPHFQLGVAVGAGFTNMEGFDSEEPVYDDGTIPGFAPNLVAHFGLGIGMGMDILGKLFYMDKTVREPPSSMANDYLTFDDYKIYSVGGKLRYNIISNVALIPFLLEFGGITISLGGDVMYGMFKVIGEYEQQFNDVEVGLAGLTENIDMQFNGDYTAVIEWSVFSLTSQIIAYIDIFYFFSLYTGFGISGNAGYFDIQFDGSGGLTTDNELYQTLASSADVGSLTFTTKNKFRPAYVNPTYIIGLEINILILKLTLESMVNLRNGSDVNIQLGTRIGI